MHYNCLIIDDEEDLAKATSEYFNIFNVNCIYITKTEQWNEFIKNNTVDIILLDINLGGESGFELCKDIRKNYNVPIIFISARQSDDDILMALNIGGDDYIKKPYTLSVILAKVKVLLKRLTGKTTIINGNEKFIVDGTRMTVTINNREIMLKAKEFALLSYLYNNKNKIVSKNTLFNEIWGDSFFSDGTLNVHIRKIREKIEADPNNPKFIKTIWGVGYILELE